MATKNLWFGKISSTSYSDLETVTGLTFADSKKYVVQVQTGAAYFCESDDTPTAGGFVVRAGDDPFEITYNTNVYVRNARKDIDCYVNIAGEANDD